jgi:hypothetical protein
MAFPNYRIVGPDSSRPPHQGSTRGRRLQPLQMGSLPSWASQKGFDLLAPVDGTAIPDDQQPHRDVGGQVPQEAGRIPAAEGPVLYPGVQPAMGGDAA